MANGINVDLNNVFMPQFRYLNTMLMELQKSNYLKYKWMILSGSRKAGKTYAIINFFLLLSMLLSHGKEKSVIVITRHKSVQIKDIWKQFEHQMDRLHLGSFFGSNKTDGHMWTLNNKVDIFFRSVYDPKGETSVKGLPRLNYDKAFVVFDESDQMTQQEIDAMLEAVEAQETMPIWLFNPNSIDEYIVGRANMLVPESEEIMINGSGNHFAEVRNEVGQLGVVHRVNYKVNKFLSEEEVKRFKLQAKLNPRRARTAVYGLTGNAGDRSYMDFSREHNVISLEKDAPYFNNFRNFVSHYQIGVDFGTTVGHASGAVLDVFYENAKYGATAREWYWENDSLEGVPIYKIENDFKETQKISSEKQWDRAQVRFAEHLEYLESKEIKVYKDNERLALELINHVEYWASLPQFNNMRKIGVKMRVDPGGGGKSFKLAIEKEINKRHINWIKVKQAKKEKVDYRQQLGNDLFASGWKISEHCKLLIKEVEGAKNDEKKKELGIIQREKRNDNLLDPFDYAKETKEKRLTKFSTVEYASDKNGFGIYEN